MPKYTNVHGPLILAHRGGAGEVAENTLDAFHHAIETGITHLETDVRLAADGTLYLVHGATSLLPNQPLRLAPHKRLVTLAELFDAFPDACFAIDPKHNLAIEPLARLITQRHMEDQVCIGSSFSARTKQTVARIEALGGKRPATALVSAWDLACLLTKAKNPNTIHATYIHVPAKLISQTVINTAHSWDLSVIAWVLNDETSIQKALAMGVVMAL